MLDVKKISGRLALDIGAHVGTWSMQLATVFDKVIAFEPSRVPHKTLLENLQLNNIHNVQVIKSAVSDTAISTTLNIYYGSLSGAHTLLNVYPPHDGSSKNKIREESVVTVTLDSHIKSPVDFIKIDVEGAEASVLNGAMSIINRSNPTIIIEIHTSIDRANEVISILGEPNEILLWGSPMWKLTEELQKKYNMVRGNYFIYNRGEYNEI